MPLIFWHTAIGRIFLGGWGNQCTMAQGAKEVSIVSLKKLIRRSESSILETDRPRLVSIHAGNL